MKVYRVVCPSCKADLNIKKDIEFVKCEYCGSKVFVDDEIQKVEVTKNFNKTIKDETKIKESESKERVNLKKLEYADKKDKRNYIVIFGIFAIPILIYVLINILSSAGRGLSNILENIKNLNKIQPPISSNELDDNYEIIKRNFEDADFKNVELFIECDKDIIDYFNVGKVKKVTINGNSNFSKYDYYNKDVKVTIFYIGSRDECKKDN